MRKIINEFETAVVYIVVGMIYTAPFIVAIQAATVIFKFIAVLTEVLL